MAEEREWSMLLVELGNQNITSPLWILRLFWYATLKCLRSACVSIGWLNFCPKNGCCLGHWFRAFCVELVLWVCLFLLLFLVSDDACCGGAVCWFAWLVCMNLNNQLHGLFIWMSFRLIFFVNCLWNGLVTPRQLSNLLERDTISPFGSSKFVANCSFRSYKDRFADVRGESLLES